MREVRVERKYEERKLVDAILHIYPSDLFINQMLLSNTLTKRLNNSVVKEGKLLIEPDKREFNSEKEYNQAALEFIKTKLE